MPPPHIHLFEFYSGLGGWHQAFSLLCQQNQSKDTPKEHNTNKRHSLPQPNDKECHNEEDRLAPITKLSVVKAFDINVHANKAYKHNHPHVRIDSTNIEHLKVAYFDGLIRKALRPQMSSSGGEIHLEHDKTEDNLLVWSLSPPCQPFTKGGRQQDINDTRSNSFAHLLKNILPNLETKPDIVMVENVKNFELSQMRHLLLSTLKQCGYTFVEEFLACPHTLLRWPNERKRYYLVACLKRPDSSRHDIDKSSHEDLAKAPHSKSCPFSENSSTSEGYGFSHHKQFFGSDPAELRRHLNTERDTHQLLMEKTLRTNKSLHTFPPKSIGDVLLSEEHLGEDISSLLVPCEVLQRLGERGYNFDVVHSSSVSSACFTKGYGCPANKFVKGSGSLLATSNVHLLCATTSDTDDDKRYISDWKTLRKLTLRRFHSVEIARLLGFPDDSFAFTTNSNQQQCSKLLGNSIHVQVVAIMILRGLFLYATAT